MQLKMAYDWDKGACKAPPKVGDRVHMKVPSEKQSSRNPKLANSWEGPYRVIESSDNSALLTFTQDNREPVHEANPHCGGTPTADRRDAAVFPLPYEDVDWTKMGGSFDTSLHRKGSLRPWSGPILQCWRAPHPATCLANDPHYKRTPFIGRKVVHYLEKMRQYVMRDILKVGKFGAASAELKQQGKKPNELAGDVMNTAKISP
ncbi:unnamed protein product [Heligmosomoides polygyrus]|uniref:Reverse transcriptase domain-containing protein n=1 Tax=Heligmosomoides polygyrus TaxID=6339 RepID=A0A183FQP8_HELPZ|nr:unnamed protein product [Heligmosomoides polygyrus]